MGEMKHTPGPWRASAPDDTYHDVIRIHADSRPDLPVAVCPQMRSAFMEVIAGTTGGNTEAAANARLIAAAPGTLAALIEADGCFEAALAEGWLDALTEGDVERIRDIWTRRIGPARHALAVGMAALHDAGWRPSSPTSPATSPESTRSATANHR